MACMNYERDFRDCRIGTRYGHVAYKHHEGPGHAIIFIHGLATNSKTWSKLMAFLPADLDLYLIDLLGHGESDAPSIKYTIGIQVELLKEIIRHEKLDDVYLFGHSYGGWVVAKYAESAKVKGIIIEDSGGLEGFYNETRGTKSREEYMEQLLDKSLMLGGKRHVIKSIIEDEFKEGQLNEENLNKIKARTLILWGSNDAVIDIKYSKVFLNNIMGSELRTIQGARHTPHYTHPEEVSKHLIEFINR